jgi:hypothetical protein
MIHVIVAAERNTRTAMGQENKTGEGQRFKTLSLFVWGLVIIILLSITTELPLNFGVGSL